MIRALRIAVFTAVFTAFAALAQTPAAKGAPSATSPNSLLDMVDQLHKLDSLDKRAFLGALDEAEACTRRRRFSCSEAQIAKAAKLVNGSQDQRTLALARQNLVAERRRVDEEIQEAERERVAQAESERQQQQAQARAEAAAEDRQQTSANISGLFSILGATASNYAVIKSQQQAAAKLGNNILADAQRAADIARENNEQRAREARQQQAGQQASLRPTPNLATTAYGGGASAGSGAVAGVSAGAATASNSGGSGQFFVYSRQSREEACELSMRRTKENGQDITGTCSCNTLNGSNNCRAEVRSASSASTASSALSPAVTAAAQACPKEYSGPDDDPQFDSFCKLAQINQCLDRVTSATTYAAQTQAACNTLDQMLRKTKGGRAANYCSYCK